MNKSNQLPYPLLPQDRAMSNDDWRIYFINNQPYMYELVKKPLSQWLRENSYLRDFTDQWFTSNQYYHIYLLMILRHGTVVPVISGHIFFLPIFTAGVDYVPPYEVGLHSRSAIDEQGRDIIYVDGRDGRLAEIRAMRNRAARLMDQGITLALDEALAGTELERNKAFPFTVNNCGWPTVPLNLGLTGMTGE